VTATRAYRAQVNARVVSVRVVIESMLSLLC